MKKMPVAFLAAVSVSALCVYGTETTWKPMESGTFDWNDVDNWDNGIPTFMTTAKMSGQEASDQTVSGDGTAKTFDLNNKEHTRVRTFTGDISAENAYFRKGVFRVAGELSLTGSDSFSVVGTTGSAGPACGVLEICEGGSIVATNVHAICVGARTANDQADAAGALRMRAGGKLILNPSDATASMAGLQLCRINGEREGTHCGAYVQEGGEAVLGRLFTGFESFSWSSVAMLGGSLDLRYINNTTRFRIGHNGYSSFTLLGGDVFVLTNTTEASLDPNNRTGLYSVRSYMAFEIGSQANNNNGVYFYANAGTVRSNGDISILGQGSSGMFGLGSAHMTIDGVANIASTTVRVGANSGPAPASLNLNGGVLTTKALYAQSERSGMSAVNANGGKIVFPAGALNNQFYDIKAVNIYEKGLEIEVDSGMAINIGNPSNRAVTLRTPTGYGLDIDSVTKVHSNLNPPRIHIDGGSGSNATAVSFQDYATGTNLWSMTNAVIVCRGEGYAKDDVVTAHVRRPFGSTDLTDKIALSLSTNMPGPLVKSGPGDLNLFAQPEFAGTYECRGGMLRQSTAAGTAAPRVTAVVIGGSDAFFQAGSGNETAIKKNWNPINPTATLTLGTSYGPGTLLVPFAWGDEESPFEQSFASLTVNGTGNQIATAGGGGLDTGAKVTFGTVSFAEGAELTIPKWDSLFKVYVTGLPPGKRLKNVKFSGVDENIRAMVAEDGQLVNAPTGDMRIIIR